MIEIPIKQIKIPKEWTTHQHNLVDLEPDNDLPIDDAFWYFSDDLCQFTYQDYLIDIGYFGEYLDDRDGGYTVFIAKGDFLEGELYEKMHTRSLTKVVELVEKYAQIIVNGDIDALPARYFEDSNTTPVYSALSIHK